MPTRRYRSNYNNRPSGMGRAVPAGGAMVPRDRLGSTPIPPTMSGLSGGPSSSADVSFSMRLGTPLAGCPDPYFDDCPEEDEDEEPVMESLRELIHLILAEDRKTSEDSEKILDEDEIEEDPDLEEYSSVGGAGGIGNFGYMAPVKGPAPHWGPTARSFGNAKLATGVTKKKRKTKKTRKKRKKARKNK